MKNIFADQLSKIAMFGTRKGYDMIVVMGLSIHECVTYRILKFDLV